MFRPLMLAIVPVAAMACYSTPVYTYPDPLPPPPPPPRETVVTQAPAQPGNTTIIVQGQQPMQPMQQACAASFYDEHPVPAERGGGWCTVRGPHCHDYLPAYTEQYVYRDNSYYFGADVEFYYSDYHPVPPEFGGGWCNVQGTHAHRYRPWRDFDFEPTRRVYVYRPTPTPTYGGAQRPTPTYGNGGIPYGNDVRTYPASGTQTARPVPAYPTAQPTYPQPQPSYPAGGTARPTPSYPTAQPTYPTAQPTYPTAQPTYPAAQPTSPQPQPTYAQPVPSQPAPTQASPRPLPYGNDVQAHPATIPVAQPVPAPGHPQPGTPAAGNVEIIRFDHPVQPQPTATVYEPHPSTPVVSNPAQQPRPSPSSPQPMPATPAPTGSTVYAQPVSPMGTVVQPQNPNAFQNPRPYEPPTPHTVQPGSQGQFRTTETTNVGRVLPSDRMREVKIDTVNANAAAPAANAPGQQKKRLQPTPVPSR